MDRDFFYTVSTPTRVGDLYSIEAAGQPKQLTHANDGSFLASESDRTRRDFVYDLGWKANSGLAAEPPDFDPQKKYPLILNIHGGPHAAYGYVFDHEFQWMAAKGYVVLYPNPRGSTIMARISATSFNIIIQVTITKT